MYINIARASRQSSSDTDDVIPSRLSTKEPSTDESNRYCRQSTSDTDDVIPSRVFRMDNKTDEGNTYYNNADILTTIKIQELKDYIKRKQVNEGLHSEYKVIFN